MKFKKRILVIAGVHLIISVSILFFAIILTAQGIPDYPKHIHPPVFLILQRVINFPIVIIAGYILLFVMKTFKITASIYAIVALTLVAIPFNSLLWGFSIDRIICFVNKRN